MKVLADTNLFVKFCRRLPLPKEVEKVLADEKTERCLSPISVVEIFRLWKNGHIPANPDTWLDLALPSWTVLRSRCPLRGFRFYGPWEHKDPADRILAATAEFEGIALWHTDTVLKKITGFPQRYFVNAA